MNNNQQNIPSPKETPVTRKRRLHARLQEISARSEEELASLMRSIDKMKSSLKNKSKQ